MDTPRGSGPVIRQHLNYPDRVTGVVAVLAMVIAVVSARPYAGAWNDGSRLAAAESLVERRTWQIEDSIFVAPAAHAQGSAAYSAFPAALRREGTQDKLWIGGHFYSDKSPVPNLALAGIYKALQMTTGLRAPENPGGFVYWLTLLSSGTAFVLSAVCVSRMTYVAGLAARVRLLVLVGFMFATIALPYTRQVNHHIILLAVASAVVLCLTRALPPSPKRALLLGCLAGSGYAIDPAVGGVLLLMVVLLVGYRSRKSSIVAAVFAGALPWVLLHHYLNYRIAGTFVPANAVAEYFRWPGSPWQPEQLTGHFSHATVFKFVEYALDLLFGKKGFLGHNLALFVALPGTVLLVRRGVAETAEIVTSLLFMTGSWLVYAAASNNYSGACCSVRWFVPLLAPGFYLLTLVLKHDPPAKGDLVIVTMFAVPLGLMMWWGGPWRERMVPGYWFYLGGTLLTWLIYRWYKPRPEWKNSIPRLIGRGNRR